MQLQPCSADSLEQGDWFPDNVSTPMGGNGMSRDGAKVQISNHATVNSLLIHQTIFNILFLRTRTQVSLGKLTVALIFFFQSATYSHVRLTNATRSRIIFAEARGRLQTTISSACNLPVTVFTAFCSETVK